jgi:penicillin amidase
MKILRILLLVLLLIVIVVLVGGFVFFNDTTRGMLPQHNGELSVAGLNEQVEILRDSFGVPHIYASNLYDLYFAQGFTHAQDRWWQMEFWRHTGAGRIQELTGQNDSLMGTDVFIQTVGWYRAAERDAQALDEQSRVSLQAFANGVNAYISGRSQDDLAMEYRLLGVTGVNITVQPWTITDTLVWGKVMAWNLTDSYDRELIRASLLDSVGEAMSQDYTPPYPFGTHPTILFPEDLPLTAESMGIAASAMRVSSDTPNSLIVAGGLNAAEVASDPGIGSNNWVATGSMTESGMPLLANDPHLSIQMPSIWYEIGLHCQPVTDACPMDVVGFALSPVPGIIIGHNANIAWAMTNVGADVQDLYQIKVNPDNPLQYEWNGEWRDMIAIETEIRFGDNESPVPLTIRETHLGPIINDNRRDPETGELLGFNNEDPLALRWTGLDISSSSRAIFLFNAASNWTEFRVALQDFNVPAQNFIYADREGNIGYQTPGSMPIRASGHDGLTPVDGSTDTFEWQGYIPFDNLPRIFNPGREYIATANQAVVPMEYYDQLADQLGEDANYVLSYDWSYGYRGQRIVDLMESLAPHNAETYRQIHGDNKNLAAEDIMPYLSDLSLDDTAIADARDWLATWDYMNNMDSAQAVYFSYFADHLVDAIFADQLPEDVSAGGQQVWAVVVMLEDPENIWWDDELTTDVTETRDDILVRALTSAWADATANHGDDRGAWRWGALHTATFVSNPLGASGISLIEDMVNRGPVETGGGSEIVNATGSRGDFTVGSLPSMRMIVDMANLDNSLTIHTTGQSGHPYSDHYGDMIDLWRNIEYKPMLFTREAVEAGAANRLILNPAS